MSSFAVLFAQATNAAPAAAATPDAPPDRPWWSNLMFPLLVMAMVYFALIRPQSVAKKKQEETLKAARTGDKVITTSGIHGVITNVKETTVIVKVADNVKLEIEKSHLEKITRPEAADSEKTVVAKA